MDVNAYYQPPQPSDYENVRELNQAWLLASGKLNAAKRSRLARSPFLLFSLREQDIEWWQRALLQEPDMLVERACPDLCTFQAAALGFLWHLAGGNPYAARIVSGASLSWCETITDLPLVTLVDRMAWRADLVLSRLEEQGRVRASLVAEGASTRPQLRRSSQLVALHEMLTNTRSDGWQRMAAAACRVSAAKKKV